MVVGTDFAGNFTIWIGFYANGELDTFGVSEFFKREHSANFARNIGDPDNGIDPDLAKQLFAAKVNDYVQGEATEGAVVAQLTGITPAVAADHKDDAKLVSDKLQQDINQELTGQFSAALQQEIPVTRNNELIDKVLSEE